MSAPATIPSPVHEIQSIPGVDAVLRVLLRMTGHRIALVARVSEDSWTCCAVLDLAGFGLAPGDGLEVSTTY